MAQDQAQFQADAVLFGPDDGSSVNLFLEDSVAATVNDSPTTNDPGQPPSLSHSNLLQDTPPYKSYDLSTAVASLFDQQAPWPMPPQLEFASLNNSGPSHQVNAFSHSPRGDFTFTSALHSPTDGLTAAQRERLKSIAMPAHLQYHSPGSDGASPISPVDFDKPDGISNDDPLTIASKTSSRKRKSTDDLDDDEDEDDDVDITQPVKKTAHNMIEKRYRTNLNDKIAALRDSVPSLRIMSKSARGEDTTLDREELHGLTPAHKLNKATVLSKATEYIRHLEKRNNRLMDENTAMQARIAAFEKLFMAGAMNGTMSPMQQPPTQIQYNTDAASYISPQLGATSGPDPPGMIQVPEDMRRIISAQMAVGQPYPIGSQQQQQPFQNPVMTLRQQQIQQQQQMQRQRWSNAPPGYYGKLMVGSLAGLMILEAFREKEVSNEKTEGRGLSALPLSLFDIFSSSASFSVAGCHVSGTHLLWSFKLLLLGCAFYWAFLAHLHEKKKTKGDKIQQPAISLEITPSLASPICVRRQAWLTAIQTVWVPEQSWWLEVVALILKTLKANLRNLIGSQNYQMLTGVTEEQEAARVKAWSIAMDAQLTGGDDEINKARLLLTYLASGTLPDTPLRLMQKALHLRLLMWELRNTQFTFGIVNVIAMEKARAMWNDARQLNVTLRQLRGSSKAEDDEELPNHLDVLLEQDCSDVLNDGILQRAYNLAWNLPTSQDAIGPTDGMDMVVDDHSIRSPLDATAAWYSSLLLQQALGASLNMDGHDTTGNREVEATIDLAIKTAPVGSIAQSRALIARAVVFDERRGVNVANALQVIGSLNPDKAAEKLNSPLLDAPLSIVSTPDSRMALRCAMVMAMLNKHSVSHPSFQMVEQVAVNSTSSLLGWTAAYKLMKRLHGHPSAAREIYAGALERLSGSLRIWMGNSAGEGCGLDSKTRNKFVERCLAITKSVVGMEVDTGYGSLSDTDETEALN